MRRLPDCTSYGPRKSAWTVVQCLDCAPFGTRCLRLPLRTFSIVQRKPRFCGGHHRLEAGLDSETIKVRIHFGVGHEPSLRSLKERPQQVEGRVHVLEPAGERTG